ncbi:class I SAM-dependent methyltransferase, partial [Rhizobium ruizarguesonis]
MGEHAGHQLRQPGQRHRIDLVGEIEGPVLEFGLGNGRTYDHLRENFPGRRIVAFDWEVRSYSASTPESRILPVTMSSASG